jgi:uroporphyrinogen decarboxylase
MDDFRNKFRLGDPEDGLYEPLKAFIDQKEEFAVIFSTRLGFMSTLISIGFQTYFEALYLDPELIDAVTGAYVDWYAKVIRRVCDMGVDAVFTADDFAFGSGPFISPASFRTRVLPYLKRASREISVPWILHTDGNILPLVEDLLTLGIKGIHPIDPNCMDIRAFKQRYGGRVCVLGNVNVDTLTAGTPEEAYAETRDLIRDLAPGYGYILSSGNSIPEFAREENVRAMLQAHEEVGQYRTV